MDHFAFRSQERARRIESASESPSSGRSRTRRWPPSTGRRDVFTLPSIARSEAFGIVQIEALAAALPVVNTELDSGVPDVSVHDVTGLTVPPNDPDSLSGALNRLLDKPELAQTLGARGRERALKCFTAERMVDETLAVYQAVIGLGEVPRAQLRHA